MYRVVGEALPQPFIFGGDNYMFKKFLVCCASVFTMSLIGGGVYVSADTTCVSDSFSVTTDSGVTFIGAESAKAIKSRTETTRETTIGTSGTGQIIVSTDTMFTGLETLVDFYGSGLDATVRDSLIKSLTELVVSVVAGDSGYTMDTFKVAFLDILSNSGIQVTDELVDAVDKYTSYYLDSQFEEDETQSILVWIGGTVGMMTTLFLTSQLGGVHRS